MTSMIANLLVQCVESKGGMEAAMQEATAIYDGTFRYPAKSASALSSEMGISFASMAEDIHTRLVDAAFSALYGAPDLFDMDDAEVMRYDFERESFEDECEIPMPELTPDTLISVLCNYKGESLDAGTFCLDVEPIPVFHGKYKYS